MFEARLEKASILKKIIDAVKDLINDAPFDCSENAICIQAMDSSQVALVSLHLSSKLFETYRCDRTLFGLNVTNIIKSLKCANNDDICILRSFDRDPDKFTFAFNNVANTKTQEITLNVINVDCEQLGIPDQKYAATIKMSSSEFAKTCRDLSQFTDYVTISALKGGVSFSGKGDTGSNVVTYNGERNAENDDDALITFAISENVISTFSLKFMVMFSKASGLSDRVRLSLSEGLGDKLIFNNKLPAFKCQLPAFLCQLLMTPEGLPIVVEYKINEDSGFLRYYLAPKIDENANNMD